MRTKHNPGHCDCCGCLLYIHYFPDYPNEQVINWDDDYSQSIGSGFLYLSDFTLPAAHYEIDLSMFYDQDILISTTQAGFAQSTNTIVVQLVDPVSTSSNNLWLKFYLRDDSFTYTESGGTTTGYRHLKFICEESTALQSDKCVLEWLRVGPFTTTLTGFDLAGWKTDLETSSWSWSTWKNTLQSMIIEVRETHVTIRGSQGVGWIEGDVPQYDDLFAHRHFTGVPLFTGAIAASRLKVTLSQPSTSYDGEMLVIQGTKDTIGSTNSTCPERNCRYIDDYHAQDWPLTTSTLTLTGTTTVTSTPDVVTFGNYTFCNRNYITATEGELVAPRKLRDIEATDGLPYTVVGSVKLCASMDVRVLGDEFSDGTITTGKIKLRVSLGVSHESPIPGALPIDPTARLDFTRVVSDPETLSHSDQSDYPGLIQWELEVDRWAGNSQPTLTLTGADSEVITTSGTEIWVLDEVAISKSGALYSMHYTTTKFDLVNVLWTI